MRKFHLYLIIIFILFFLGSCISLKIKSFIPPENQVENIELCRKIDDSGELLIPKEIQNEFTIDDKHVICFIRIKDISTRITLRWKWYSPQKMIARDTGDIVVNEGEKYLLALTAYDKLQFLQEEKFDGKWTVVIFMNDKFIGKRNFRVTSSR
ncbi:MAG: hypothetical protein ACE5GI_09630 [Candidatus Aminicenantales bacterium]